MTGKVGRPNHSMASPMDSGGGGDRRTTGEAGEGREVMMGRLDWEGN